MSFNEVREWENFHILGVMDTLKNLPIAYLYLEEGFITSLALKDQKVSFLAWKAMIEVSKNSWPLAFKVVDIPDGELKESDKKNLGVHFNRCASGRGGENKIVKRISSLHYVSFPSIHCSSLDYTYIPLMYVHLRLKRRLTLTSNINRYFTFFFVSGTRHGGGGGRPWKKI